MLNVVLIFSKMFRNLVLFLKSIRKLKQNEHNCLYHKALLFQFCEKNLFGIRAYEDGLKKLRFWKTKS